MIGFRIEPPAHALVPSVGGRSQIQALDRTQPRLPMQKSSAGTMTHDYMRHCTTTLFAALSVLDGTVYGRTMQRRRHQELIHFLNLLERNVPAGEIAHLILDNYAAHKHPKIRAWLARHRLAKRRLKRGVFAPKRLVFNSQRPGRVVRRWCAAHYPDVAVQADIHDPLVAAREQGAEATRDDLPNVHAHLFRTTRRVGPDGLERKLRPEDRPDGLRFGASGRVVQGSDWPKRWAAFQNEFFEEKGLDLRVAPVSLSPGLHLGKKAARRKDSWVRRENAVLKVEAMAALRQADELVEYLREWVPVYGESDLAAIAQVHGKAVAKPLDVAKRLASRRRVEPLSDPDTGEPIRLWRVRAEDESAPEPQPVVPPVRRAAAEEARRRNALVEEEALLVRLRRRLAALLIQPRPRPTPITSAAAARNRRTTKPSPPASPPTSLSASSGTSASARAAPARSASEFDKR